MPFQNGRGDIFHGVGGGFASVNNVPFSAGGAAGFIDDDECFYANGDAAWVAYIHNIRTGLNRPAVEQTTDPQFGQSLNHGFAGGGVWAAWQGVQNEHRGLYSSTGFRLPDGGLMAVGPDGAIGYKPNYQSGGPTKVITVDGQRRVAAALAAGRTYDQVEPELEADGSIWTVTPGHAYDLQLLGGRRACWQESLTIRVAGLEQPRQLSRCWRPEAHLVDGVWWISYFCDSGIILHPFDSFVGYRITPPGLDTWHSARVLTNGTLQFALSSGIAEQGELRDAAGRLLRPGQLRAQPVDFSRPRVDLAAGPDVVLEPTTRPYYLGFFEFLIGQASKVSSPGNCSLFVRGVAGQVSTLRPAVVTSETVDTVSGAILGIFLSGDSVESIEQVCSVATKRPVAYWDARTWPRMPKLPPDSWLCLQVYQRQGETAAALEQDIERELARVPAGQQVALVAQCYTSNANLTTELRPMVGVVNRLANRHPNIVAVLVFSGSGRRTGLDDHPEVLPLWLELAAGIPTPTFREYENMPVRPVITIAEYAKTLRPNQSTNLVKMTVGDTEVVVRLDANSNLFVDARNAAGEEHTGRTDRHVAISGGTVVDPPPPPPPANDVVTFYDDINFQGQARTYPGNTAFVDAANDRISSIRVPAGKTVVVFENRDFVGRSMTLTKDVADLREFAGPGKDGTWNDAISSLKLTADNPPPPPPVDPSTQTTSFRTVSGHLLSVENGKVVATKSDPDGSEQFSVERIDDETVALKSGDRYVGAVDGGGRELVVSATKVDRNERFKPRRAAGGAVALEVANGTFVSPQQGGGGIVLADGPTVGAWEPLRASRSLWPSQGRVGRGAVRAAGRVFVDDDGPFSPFGTSLFWAYWAYVNDRAKLLSNLSTCQEVGVDYTRDFGEVGGGSWEDRVINPNDADYRDNWAGLLDLKFGKFNLRTALTIFAGGTGANVDATCDKIISAIRGREESILYLEVSNERKLDTETHRRLVQKLRAAFPSMLVASSSPGDTPNGLNADVFDLSVANLLIVHTERQSGDEDWRQERQPVDVYDFSVPGDNNEPPGLQSSVAMLSDPLRLAMLRAVGITSGLGAFVLHTGAGVRGGGAADLATGKFYLPRKSNLAEYQELPAVAAALLNISSIVPVDASNWRKTKGHWADTQLFADMVWSDDPANLKHGCVRVYGSYTGQQYVENVIGVRDFVNLTQKMGAAHVRAIDPLTQSVVFEKDVADGETFRLEGDKDGGSDAAYIVIGTR